MFKVDDKVTCVDITVRYSTDGIWANPPKKIEIGGIYTIKNPNGGSNDVELLEIKDVFYHNSRFIPLREDRIRKLKKLRYDI